MNYLGRNASKATVKLLDGSPKNLTREEFIEAQIHLKKIQNQKKHEALLQSEEHQRLLESLT